MIKHNTTMPVIKRILFGDIISINNDIKNLTISVIKKSVKIDAYVLMDYFLSHDKLPATKKNVYPPFTERPFWMEYSYIGIDGIKSRHGFLMEAFDLSHKRNREFIQQKYGMEKFPSSFDINILLPLEDFGWGMIIHHFIDIPNLPVFGPLTMTLTCIDKDGTSGQWIYADYYEEEPYNKYFKCDRKTREKNWNSIFGPSVFHLCQFLSCKNVQLEEQLLPGSINKKLIKRHSGQPDNYKYHTIVVTNKYNRVNLISNKTDFHMPLHLVRGNIAHYTKTAPLFGKYIGTFYRPSHVRGSKQYGIVDKEYKLQPC
jgi:hypothetical protein